MNHCWAINSKRIKKLSSSCAIVIKLANARRALKRFTEKEIKHIYKSSLGERRKSSNVASE